MTRPEKYYPVVDKPTYNGHYRATHAGEFRAPLKGEYYLSGAIPEAYKAPNDLADPFWIMNIFEVTVETIQVVKEVLS